ncbi:MAG: valine--tRNA ligase [bacterium]|nr:valine--tRNA ligase [bacterium]
MEISKTYQPKDVEERWYSFWEKNNFFYADNLSSKEPFSIVIPPPNITGYLHMGHALNNTLQDIIIRTKRMQGYNALWIPGTDHAGIATQNVVEKELKKQNIKREELGREEFIKRVWEWREQYGNQIIQQLKRLGCSCDWSRLRFTMDEGLSKAVREVFITLYEEGLIYQDNYIVNWCPRCHTALSDIEVEHKETFGKLYYLKYPLVYNPQEYIVVATTRPETMLGDTAVAINPNDERYRSLLGQKALLPILKREIPIISDSFVDPSFGTGAVKVTPAHDPNDFEIGKRHSLEEINILNKDATLNSNAGHYKDLDRFHARQKLLKDLEELNFIEKTEDYKYSIGHCYRCHTVVEPYLSKQWFVNMKSLADSAIKAVKENETTFIPKSWEKTYFEWMYNIKDWCISRQIWWGHRIPVWYCSNCNNTIVSRTDIKECPKCMSKNIKQDEDVLDTWFSSSLWPFSTLGFPENTKDLETFYPTSVLSTGFDIIFFWVARMIMMGLKFQNKVPFKKVYIHALIKDACGQKMSKSSGNVIDPIEIIDKFGTDALRFTLAIMAIQGRDILLSQERIKGYRHFCNKIWNATRFILMNTKDFNNITLDIPDKLTLADRWIISKANQLIDKVTISIESYQFNEASQALYDFIWHEFCDWYIELAKINLNNEKRRQTQIVLLKVLCDILKLLHPFMPFITEEIWCNLPIRNKEESIMISPWPKSLPSIIKESSIQDMNYLKEVITLIRNLLWEMDISPKTAVKVILKTTNLKKLQLLQDHTSYIKGLITISKIEISKDLEKPKHSVSTALGELKIFLPLEGIIDFQKEKVRLGKEIQKIEKELGGIRVKLNNKEFLNKAKEEVVKEQQQLEEEFLQKKEHLETHLKVVEESINKI